MPDTRLHHHATCVDTNGATHEITGLYGHTERMRTFARQSFKARGVEPARGSVQVRVWTAEEVAEYHQRMQELRKEWER